MTPERWQQVDEIFQAAIELNHAARPPFLDTSCAGDKELRREVESLITADEQGLSFIDSPAYEVAARFLLSETPELHEGQHIGHYQIVSMLGAGGMGEVYLAQDTTLGRQIALKLLPSEFTGNPERLRRFQQEARAVSALNHPNILTLHEINHVEDRHFIATEFVDGETLRQRLRRSRLSLGEAVDIAIQVAGAVAAAHQAGIVHRDIKPENIMLRPDAYVKVLDFGLAKLTEQQGPPTAPGAAEKVDVSPGLVMGTVKYMSPEQALGLSVDSRSDIFSFGVVLYEMVVGRAPFDAETASELISTILENEPVLPSHLSNELRIVIRKCLHKDKDQRYGTAETLLNDLRRLKKTFDIDDKLDDTDLAKRPRVIAKGHLNTSSVGATATASSVEYVSERKQHNPRAIFALAGLVIAAAGISFGLYKLVKSRRAGAPFQNIAVRKLTNFGDGWAPSISPDGKYIVYARNNEEVVSNSATTNPAVFSLWLRAVGNTSEVQLVPPTSGRCYTTSFSPDGKYIYYGVGAGEPITLFVIPTVGGNPTELPLKRAFPIGLSPDGNFLAYLDSNATEGKTSLVVANADGTDKREIITRQEANYFRRTVKPTWSPDGKLIACVGRDRGKSFPHVFVVNIDARIESTITSQRWADIRGIAWLPDMNGLLLVAAEETSSIPQIWHLSYPGGEARRITNDGVNYSRVDLTADGKALVTTGGEISTSIWVMPVEDSDPNSNAALSVDMSKAGKISVATLTSRDDLNNVYERLSWTPDGRIVYMSKESGNADIWSMNSDGGDHRQLTTDPHSDIDSVASPDGRYIAFVSNRAGAENIWIMDSNGGNQRQLTSQFIERSPDFSADSKWVFFNSWETGKATIWKVPVEGGTPIQVIPSASFFPTLSPDGTLLAYIGDHTTSSGKEVIFITPSTGGSPIRSFEGNYVLNWTPDGKGLTYPWNGPIEGQPNRKTFNLWEQTLAGSESRQLTRFPEPIFVHAWSRDGKKLVVLTAKYSSDIVLISDVQ